MGYDIAKDKFSFRITATLAWVDMYVVYETLLIKF